MGWEDTDKASTYYENKTKNESSFKKEDKVIYKKPAAAIFLASILLFSALVAFPHQLAAAESIWFDLIGYGNTLLETDYLEDVFSKQFQIVEPIHFENSDKNLRLIGDAAVVQESNPALSLSGKNGHVVVTNSGYSDELYGLTVSAWVKPDYSNGAAEFTVVSKEKSFMLTINKLISPEKVAKFSVFDGLKWYSVESSSIIEEKWTHLAATFVDSELSIYVNGKLESTISNIGIPSVDYISSDSEIIVGAYTTNNGLDKILNTFAGEIDDIQLFYLPLYPSEIKTLYDKKLAAESSSIVTQISNDDSNILENILGISTVVDDFPKSAGFLAGVPLAHAQPGLPLEKKSSDPDILTQFNFPFGKQQNKINHFYYFSNTIAGSHLQIKNEFNFPFQTASADQSGWHEFCWDEMINLFDFLIDIAQAFIWLFGPAIVVAATILALFLGILMVNVCNPQLIPPPQFSAEAVVLECNVPGGFKTDSFTINVDDTSDADGFFTVAKTATSLSYSRPTNSTHASIITTSFPDIHEAGSFFIFLMIIIPTVVGAVVGSFPALKALFAFLINLLFGLLAGILDYKFALSQNDKTRDDGSIGYAALGYNVKKIEFDPSLDTSFTLGSNKLKYKGTVTNMFGAEKHDVADFYFNVVDTQKPKMSFEINNVTLEANAHFGFKVDPVSIKELGKVTVFDACAGDIQASYTGPKFYPLSLLKDNREQLSFWFTEDKGYSMTPIPAAALDKFVDEMTDEELGIFAEDIIRRNEIIQNEENFTNTEQIRGLADVTSKLITSNTVKPGLAFALDAVFDKYRMANLLNADARVRFSDVPLDPDGKPFRVIRNFDDTGKLEKLKKLYLTTPKDVAFDNDLFKNLDDLDSKKFAKNFKNADSLKILKKSIGGETLKALGGKAFGSLLGAGATWLGEGLSEAGKPQAPPPVKLDPHITIRSQSIFVEDTIGPDIFIPKHVAIEVNTTSPTNGCFDSGDGPKCKLSIQTPLVFDVADPFPSLQHNFTDDTTGKTFVEVEDDVLTANFPLGVTQIAWKAKDFTGNPSDQVLLNVNVKQIGTNKVSVAFSQNITDAFSGEPKKLTLNATNPDSDPLEFFIEKIPDGGIIDSPITPVFQTKFQKEGTISRLKGITNDPTGVIADSDLIFFTDSENQRIMKINQENNMMDVVTIANVSSRPEAIAMTNTGNFVISDWPRDLIMEVDPNAEVAEITEKFDVSGLFEDPKNISLDRNAVGFEDIYVTDKQNGTITKLTDFDIFISSPFDIIAGPSNEIFISEPGQNRIFQFNSEGKFVKEVGSNLMGNDVFSNPIGLDIDGSTNLYVAESVNDRISKFNSNLDLVAHFGPRDSGDSLLDSPIGVAVNGTDIFVSETSKNRIQKFNQNDASFGFFENYNINSTWFRIPFNGTVTVDVTTPDKVNFKNTPSGATAPWHGVNRTIPTLPNDSWRADFELETDINTLNSNGFIWMVTNDTKHPSNNTGVLDALSVYLANEQLQIYQEHSGINSTSAGISISDNTTYYITVERLNSTATALGVFNDVGRTNHITDSPQIKIIDENISNLRILQHTNDFENGGDPINLNLDNTVISSLFTWLGKCTDGPNCDISNNISKGFLCTETTCTGSSAGSKVGQFNTPFGIVVNNTHLFVADSLNHRIQLFNSSGSHVQTIGTGMAGAADGEFDSPFDVSVSTLGRIYVTDSVNHRIQAFDKLGNFLFKTGSFGSDDGKFDNPLGVTVDGFRNFYVTDSSNNRIQKFDSGGGLLDIWQSSINATFPGFKEQFIVNIASLSPESLDFDSSDNIFVSDWTTENKKQIMKLTMGGNAIPQFDISQFVTDPKHIAIKSNNLLYVTDNQTKSIVIFNSQGTFNAIAQPSLDLTSLNIELGGIAINDADTIFVSDWPQERIVTLDVSGSPPTISEEFDVATLFHDPKDIAVDDTAFYVTEGTGEQKRIIKIRADKGIQEQFEIQGPPNAKRGLALGLENESDLIYFANSSDGRIVVINSSSGIQNPLVNLTETENISPDAIAINPVLSEFFTIFANQTDGDLKAPMGLTFGPDENLYVSNYLSNSVKRYNGTTGEYIDDFIPSHDRLNRPFGLLFDAPNDALYVSSIFNDRILRYNATTGDFIDVAAKKNRLDGPTGIVFGPDEKLYVSNSGIDNILSFNLTTGRADQFVKANKNGGLSNPHNLAFGPDGHLYVASHNTDTVKRFNSTSGDFIDDFVNAPELSRPSGLVFNSEQSSLFVSSTDTHKILEFDANSGDLIGEFASVDFDKPHGLTIGPNDMQLYVSSTGTNEILRYGVQPVKFFVGDWSTKKIHGLDENGTAITIVADLNDRDGEPKYLATDSFGDMWVTFADGADSKIEVLQNNDGRILDEISLNDIPLFIQVQTTNVTLGNGTVVTVDENGNMVTIEEAPTISINPEGISVDSDDKVYVSDWDNHRIVKLNVFGDFIELFKVNSTFLQPMDIAVKNGNETAKFFVSDGQTGKISKLNSELLFQEIDVQKNATALNGITKHDDSVFFVSPPDGKLLELRSDGTIVEVSDVFVEPEGISVADPDRIYVTDWKKERIIEFTSSGQRIGDPIDMSPARFLEISKLRDIEVEEGDPLSFWVADSRTATIPMLDTGEEFSFDTAPSVADKFILGSGIAVDREENFAFASTGNNTFIKFNQRGALLVDRTFAEENILEDVWSSVDPSTDKDVFYLAQRDPNQIIKMDSELNTLRTVNLGFAPTGVATDTEGNIFVSREDNKVIKIDNVGTQTTIPIPAASNITDIVIDHKNGLYAADFNLNRVQKINATTGEFIGWLGRCLTGDGCQDNQEHSIGFTCSQSQCSADPDNGFGISQFFKPRQLAIDRTGNLYVSDLHVKPGEMNAPRIQKFSNNGFFIENTLSNTTESKLKGNFVNPAAIAASDKTFFVLDEAKLHVFDVNPFSPIRIASITNITSSDVTYLPDLSFDGIDTFKFFVDDGFNKSNIALINMTVNPCDPDTDGICGSVDAHGNPHFTNFFSDESLDGRTSGTIVDRGGQVLLIRDARDSEKGVFIQADVNPINTTRAEIRACNDSTTIFLNEGNQLLLTCEAPTIEVVRGEILASFFDMFGRNGTVTIPIFDQLQFEPVEYEFIAGNDNLNTLDVHVDFNERSKTYPVPPGKTVKVDTASPKIEEVCPNPITLEAEIIEGVNRTNTDLNQKIDDFLIFEATDIDNGSPLMTSTDPIQVTHDAPEELLPLNFSTAVTFTAVDEIGNTSTCESLVLVVDTTEPDLTFPAISNDLINAFTPDHDDIIAINFDPGEARDLPPQLNLARPLINDDDHPIVCFPSPQYSFPIGRHTVYCQIPDDSGIIGRANFTITVEPTPESLFITNVTASDQSSPQGYSVDDTITVRFSQATNKQPASNKAEIDALFTINPDPIGANYTGVYRDPSTLVITITEEAVTPPIPGTTTFSIKAGSGITSAAGTITASILPSPPMDGSFNSIAPPFIKAFVAEDPELGVIPTEDDEKGAVLDDIAISEKDTLTIRFSVPTNQPGGIGVLNEEQVDELFDFPGFSIGEEYEGRWINPSTFVITILKMNSFPNLDPIIGETKAVVKASANLKNSAGTSTVSTSTSQPLTGSFGVFSVAKKVESGFSATTVLPSGIVVELKVPRDIPAIGFTKGMGSAPFALKLVGDIIDLSTTDDKDCEAGCEISFTFSNDDLRGIIPTPDGVRIFHDVNGDEFFSVDESLTTKITEIGPGIFTASATIFSMSLLGIGADLSTGGGGGGDRTPPSFESWDYISCHPEIGCGTHIVDEIKFVNDMPTAIIPAGHSAKFILRVHESSGPNALQHVTLYTNIQGFASQLYDSDTYVRYQKGNPVIIKDPNGFLSNADVTVIPRGNNVDVIFTLTFDKPMERSDIIIRAWDQDRNSRDSRFVDAIQVIEMPLTEEQTTEIDSLLERQTPQKIETTVSIPQDILEKWAGYSQEVVSDSELLQYAGIEGTNIPDWYKKNLAKWIIDGTVTQQELINALTYLNENGILT